jgi:hypothetical protein
VADKTPTPSANVAPKDPAMTKEQIAKELGTFYRSASSASGGGVKDPTVYLGMKPHENMPGNTSYYQALGSGYYDETAKLSDVKAQYFNWDPATRNKFLTQLNLAGYDTTQLRDDQVAQLWAGYAEQAAAYYSANNKLTPWDILAKDRAARESYMKTPRSVTQTSTNQNLSSREDAHALFLQAAQSLLGRDPTQAEISAFQKSVNAYEKAHPTVTTTTSNYIGDQLKSQSSNTTGGVTDAARGLMATEDIKRDPEFGAYQAATTYFDAMMAEIGG